MVIHENILHVRGQTPFLLNELYNQPDNLLPSGGNDKSTLNKKHLIKQTGEQCD